MSVLDLDNFKAYAKIESGDDDNALQGILDGAEREVFDEVGKDYTLDELAACPDLTSEIFRTALGQAYNREGLAAIELKPNPAGAGIRAKYRAANGGLNP